MVNVLHRLKVTKMKRFEKLQIEQIVPEGITNHACPLLPVHSSPPHAVIDPIDHCTVTGQAIAGFSIVVHGTAYKST